MSNRDIEVAWDYHDGTRHPRGHLMDPGHAFNPMGQPMLLKIYENLEPLPLSIDTSPLDVPALSAISTVVAPGAQGQVPDLPTLGRILYFSAGITKVLRTPMGDMSFRAAACTGALFHIELYLVCGDLPGLEAGVYHFDPRGPGLALLRRGDHRRVLVDSSGDEPSLAGAPAIIVYTDVIWRNACKYQAREYRHAFWDSGTIIAHTLAVASGHGLPARVVAGFVDESVDRLLDLGTRREVSLVMVSLGHSHQPLAGPSPGVRPLGLKAVPISGHETDFPAIREMHEASALTAGEEAASWRSSPPSIPVRTPTGRLVSLDPLVPEDASQDPAEHVIIRRGSSRRFAPEPITFRELSTALDRATRGIPADFLEPTGASLGNIYLIVNAVDGLPSGAYAYHRDRRARELLEEGEFRRQAGHLGLDQDLAADASVDVFLTSPLASVLERFGNRGYRVAQLEASITAGKLYMAAYAQRFGASGLTFFDQEVVDFFSPHSRDQSVMFLVALGKPARRR